MNESVLAGSVGVQLWVKSSSEVERSLLRRRRATSFKWRRKPGRNFRVKRAEEKRDGQWVGERESPAMGGWGGGFSQISVWVIQDSCWAADLSVCPGKTPWSQSGGPQPGGQGQYHCHPIGNTCPPHASGRSGRLELVSMFSQTQFLPARFTAVIVVKPWPYVALQLIINNLLLASTRAGVDKLRLWGQMEEIILIVSHKIAVFSPYF